MQPVEGLCRQHLECKDLLMFPTELDKWNHSFIL